MRSNCSGLVASTSRKHGTHRRLGCQGFSYPVLLAEAKSQRAIELIKNATGPTIAADFPVVSWSPSCSPYSVARTVAISGYDLNGFYRWPNTYVGKLVDWCNQ